MAAKTFDIYMLYHRNLVLPTEKFYVYIHKNPLTQKIFYVGSAQGNCMRAYEFNKHRSKSWKDEVKSFGGICNLIVEIVKYCENPIEAQKIEFKMIYELKKKGEAYCNNEGDVTFQRKYPKLKYHLYLNDIYIFFTRKTDLYLYCAENYNLSRHMVNMLIETDESYRGAKINARGLKIIREGKEHI